MTTERTPVWRWETDVPALIAEVREAVRASPPSTDTLHRIVSLCDALDAKIEQLARITERAVEEQNYQQRRRDDR